VFFEETRAVFEELSKLIEYYGITGKKTHDANIAATMKAHRIENLVTLNSRDFSAFSGMRIYSPSGALLAGD
jgi:predicted nucleic acid-binding protein